MGLSTFLKIKGGLQNLPDFKIGLMESLLPRGASNGQCRGIKNIRTDNNRRPDKQRDITPRGSGPIINIPM